MKRIKDFRRSSTVVLSFAHFFCFFLFLANITVKKFSPFSKNMIYFSCLTLLFIYIYVYIERDKRTLDCVLIPLKFKLSSSFASEL